MQLTINIYSNIPVQTNEETTEEKESCISDLNVFIPDKDVDREYLKSLFDRELLALKNKIILSVSTHYIKYLMDKYDG